MLVAPFCRQFDNNFDKLWRGYKTFRPQLTEYCRGCVPGIPGGVDAYAVLLALSDRMRRTSRNWDQFPCQLGRKTSTVKGKAWLASIIVSIILRPTTVTVTCCKQSRALNVISCKTLARMKEKWQINKLQRLREGKCILIIVILDRFRVIHGLCHSGWTDRGLQLLERKLLSHML